jgi:hypothetical protein
MLQKRIFNILNYLMEFRDSMESLLESRSLLAAGFTILFPFFSGMTLLLFVPTIIGPLGTNFCLLAALLKQARDLTH